MISAIGVKPSNVAGVHWLFDLTRAKKSDTSWASASFDPVACETSLSMGVWWYWVGRLVK